MNKTYIIKDYTELDNNFSVNIVFLNEDGSLGQDHAIIAIEKNDKNKELLDKLIAEDAHLLAKNETKKENKKTLKTFASLALVGLLASGATWHLMKEPKHEVVPNQPVTNLDNNGTNVEETELVTVKDQKEFYTEVTSEIFTKTVDSIIEEYHGIGFEADYKAVSATLFFANMQSIDSEVVLDLIDEGYLERDFTQNLQTLLNFDSKVRHINNSFALGEEVVFISVAPFAISNEKDYENILYSEEMLMTIDKNLESNFNEYLNHFSGPELKSNYTHGYDDLTIGYRVLNKRFIALGYYFASQDKVVEGDREYLLERSNDISEIVGFMNNFEGCFDNLPKTK